MYRILSWYEIPVLTVGRQLNFTAKTSWLPRRTLTCSWCSLDSLHKIQRSVDVISVGYLMKGLLDAWAFPLVIFDVIGRILFKRIDTRSSGITIKMNPIAMRTAPTMSRAEKVCPLAYVSITTKNTMSCNARNGYEKVQGKHTETFKVRIISNTERPCWASLSEVQENSTSRSLESMNTQTTPFPHSSQNLVTAGITSLLRLGPFQLIQRILLNSDCKAFWTANTDNFCAVP